MIDRKKIKDFNNLENYPDLKKTLLPNTKTFPHRTMNTRLIINEGKVAERIYTTLNGEIISLFSNPIVKKTS